MDIKLITERITFMAYRTAKFDFRLMNSLGHLKDEEFKIAYFILNTIGMNNGKRTKIFRAVIAEWAGKSEKTISRITDKLNELGIIKKDLVSDGIKTSNYYSNVCPQTEQNLDTDGQQNDENLDTDVPLNKSNKSNKNYKMQKSNKMQNSNKIAEAEVFCEMDLDDDNLPF